MPSRHFKNDKVGIKSGLMTSLFWFSKDTLCCGLGGAVFTYSWKFMCPDKPKPYNQPLHHIHLCLASQTHGDTFHSKPSPILYGGSTRWWNLVSLTMKGCVVNNNIIPNKYIVYIMIIHCQWSQMPPWGAVFLTLENSSVETSQSHTTINHCLISLCF